LATYCTVTERHIPYNTHALTNPLY